MLHLGLWNTAPMEMWHGNLYVNAVNVCVMYHETNPLNLFSYILNCQSLIKMRHQRNSLTFSLASFHGNPPDAQYRLNAGVRGAVGNMNIRRRSDIAKFHVWYPNMDCCAALSDQRLNFWTVCLFELSHLNQTSFIGGKESRGLGG